MGVRRSVTVRAPGKINLLFRVGAKRTDGYHDVASLYQAVSLFEEVTAEAAEEFSVEFGGPIDTSDLATDETNLCIAAARLLGSVTGYTGGVRLRVVKHIPIAGGMGGGSADAAATLLACDELWETGLGRQELMSLAAQLGADVPFALEGGTAVGLGRGDKLSQALAKGEFHWVIALSETGLSTPEMYAELDRHRDTYAADLPVADDHVEVDAGALHAVRMGDAAQLAEFMHNDLQAAALQHAPELVDTLELGETHGALVGMVSGSGPSCAFLVPHALAAAELQSAFTRAGTRAIAVTSPVHGARVISQSGIIERV